MKSVALHSRLGALCVVLLCLPLVARAASAPTPATAPTAEVNRPPSPEELAQAELLRSFLQLRDQLQAAQLAIVNNRVEAETNARVQTAAISEKLEAIKAAMAAERERHQAETQRLMVERERQQVETQRSMRTVLWVAAAFGAFGLIAVLLAPFLQMRAMNRISDLAGLRPELTGGNATALMPPDGAPLPDRTVSQSNQRLMSVIDRMEKRILELEQTATPPAASTTTTTTTMAPTAVTTVSNGSAEEPPRNADGGQSAWISVLMAKGRSLLSVNKAQEAVACYDEILKLDPAHTEALVRKGAALERMNRFEEALFCYNRAIESDQRNVLAYLHKGGVCNRLERYDEALECYEQAMLVEEKAR
ncbi:MAG: tetratricopeptide repeat protein [Opitutaceae bacterium]|nr:tetratricopeptide repeat protein [Opitutaceae bacterium]